MGEVTVDERYMDEALAEAALGLEAGHVPIGAVVVLGEDVVARAHWRFRPDGLLAHPELVALTAAERAPDLPGRRRETALYTTLEPCLMCMGAAMSFFCGCVVFALESPTDGAARVGDVWQPVATTPPPFRVPDIVAGVRREEAAALVGEFVRRVDAGEPAPPDAEWARSLVTADA